MFHSLCFEYCIVLSFSVNMHRFLVAKPRNATATGPQSTEAGSMVSSHGTALQLNPNPEPRPSCPSTAPPDSIRGAAVADTNHGLNSLAPSQPILVFPKRHFGQTARAFNSGWYRGRPWLEYSDKLDVCYCFPCCKFGANNDREFVFTKQGFSNWKTALEKDKGFTKHASSHCHLKSAVAANEATGGNGGNYCKPPRAHPDRKK